MPLTAPIECDNWPIISAHSSFYRHNYLGLFIPLFRYNPQWFLSHNCSINCVNCLYWEQSSIYMKITYFLRWEKRHTIRYFFITIHFTNLFDQHANFARISQPCRMTVLAFFDDVLQLVLSSKNDLKWESGAVKSNIKNNNNII